MCTFPAALVRLSCENNCSTMSSEKNSSDTSPLLQKNPTKPAYYFELIARPCLAEFFGVCLFVFIGTMSLQDGIGIHTIGEPLVPSAMAVAIAHGLAITVLIMSLGSISGGHFNPAITLGVALSGGISPVLALGYFISQILGGICGAGLCKAVLTTDIYDIIYGGAHMLMVTDPGPAILCETLISTVLVLVVIMTAVDDETKTKFCPLGVGFAVTIGILASINTTGGSMNPARSFGPAIVFSASSNVDAFYQHYVMWVGPVLGGMIAASLYRIIFASSSKRLLFKSS